ncbi:MAG: SulP family inorganic anion transporter [Eubacteriales bacterium]
MNRIIRFVPMINTVKTYSGKLFRADFVAALSTLVVTIPQCMACALIIGIDPVIGLYTAVVSIIISSIFGSSEFLITGPTNAIGLMIAMAVGKIIPGITDEALRLPETLQILCLMTLIVGIIQILFSVFKIGKLLDFVSHSVMLGFTTGAGLLIGLSQLNSWFGITIANSNEMMPYEKLWHMVEQIGQTNFYSLACGAFVIIVILLMKKFLPKFPGPFIAMIASAGIVYIMMQTGTIPSDSIKLTQEITEALPSFALPNFSFITNGAMWSSSLAVAIIALIEAIAISKALAIKSGVKVDVNQEFMAQGFANVGASFFKGIVSSGSFSKTATNYQSGAKTRMAALFTGFLLMLTLVFFKGYAHYIPTPALSGVMMVIAYYLIDVKEIKKQFKMGGADLIVAIVTFAATLIADLDQAVFVGVGLSLILYLKDSNRVTMKTLVPSERFPGQFKERKADWILTHKADILVVQFEGNLYFGVANDMEEKMEALLGRAHGFLLRMKRVNNIDLTAIESIKHFIIAAKQAGDLVVISGLKPRIHAMLKKGDIVDLVGEENLFFSEEYMLQSSNAALIRLRDIVKEKKENL